MLEMELLLSHELCDRSGVPTSVEQCRFARNFIPDEIAINRDSLLGRGDEAQLAPLAEIDGGRDPASRNPFELRRVKPDQLRQRLEAHGYGKLSRRFEGVELFDVQTRGCRG